MEKCILCEGITDSILISYFLIKQFGWGYDKKASRRSWFEWNKDQESIKWYERENSPEKLMIWGVGGLEILEDKLKQVVERSINEREKSRRFNKIVLFFDRDLRSEQECLDMVNQWSKNADLEGSISSFGDWTKMSALLQGRKPEKSHDMDILAIVLPPDNPGALETFLINALEDHSKDYKYMSENLKDLIENLKSRNFQELQGKRFADKARLGAMLSILFPDWVFSKIDDRLQLFDWEKLEIANQMYSKLRNLSD